MLNDHLNLAHTLVIPLLCAGLVSCKPSDEPQFPYGPPPESYPVIEVSVQGDKSSDGDKRGAGSKPIAVKPTEPETPSDTGDDDGTDKPAAGVVEPEPATTDGSESPDTGDDSDTGDATTGEAGIVETDTGTGPEEVTPEPVDPAAMPELDAGIREAISRKAKRRARLEARRLNGEGLKRHKARDFAGAIDKYRAALGSDARSRFPRYNLACALAMTEKSDEALQHLLALRELGYKDKVADARMDSDFESMRQDPRFRKLTAYARLVLMRRKAVPSGAMKSLAGTLRKEARFAGDMGGVSPVYVQEATVFHRPGFENQARAIAEVLSDARVRGLHEKLLQVEADVIVVVATEEDIAAAAGRALERFYDVQLHGKGRSGEYSLKLKSSGFFDERFYAKDDSETIKRSGTFKVAEGKLQRSYRETRETEDDVFGPAEKTDRVPFKVAGDTLIVKGVKYRR